MPRNYLETDANEVEDLYDSTGVDGLPDRPTSGIVDLNLFSAGEKELEFRKPVGKEAIDDPRNGHPKLLEQLSANGRTLLRKHFSTSNPIELPRGHTTVAFSEPQKHAVLKNISDETVRSSLHSMRVLVLQAVYGGRRRLPARFRKALIREESPSKVITTTSEVETDSEGNTTDGYTSEAVASYENIGISGFGTGTQSVTDVPTPELVEGDKRDEALPGISHTAIPSSGYSKGDYEPLSTIQTQTVRQEAIPSPPRKKRMIMIRSVKVMKPAYFKGIQWTRVFVTGPLDHVHNKHKLYYQICKTNVSIYSKGAREIIRHYQSEAHLRRD